jgi:hypothetical protein
MVDFSAVGNKSGKTTEEEIQDQIAGDTCMLHFAFEGKAEPFHSENFREGVTFEWVKNKIADKLEARYEDLSLYLGEKRIPEPFCLIDMGVQTNTLLIVKLAEGAVLGNEALRAQVLQDIADEEAAEKND